MSMERDVRSLSSIMRDLNKSTKAITLIIVTPLSYCRYIVWNTQHLQRARGCDSESNLIKRSLFGFCAVELLGRSLIAFYTPDLSLHNYCDREADADKAKGTV